MYFCLKMFIIVVVDILIVFFCPQQNNLIPK